MSIGCYQLWWCWPCCCILLSGIHTSTPQSLLDRHPQWCRKSCWVLPSRADIPDQRCWKLSSSLSSHWSLPHRSEWCGHTGRTGIGAEWHSAWLQGGNYRTWLLNTLFLSEYKTVGGGLLWYSNGSQWNDPNNDKWKGERWLAHSIGNGP